MHHDGFHEKYYWAPANFIGPEIERMMMTCWRWYQFTRFDKIRSAFQQFNSSFPTKGAPILMDQERKES